MQFTTSHKVGEQKMNVRFHNKLPYKAYLGLGVILCRIGGELQGDFSWNFPLFVGSQVIEEIIHNTCFVCGGLMKDYETVVKVPNTFRGKLTQVCKCTTCGHSHT